MVVSPFGKDTSTTNITGGSPLITFSSIGFAYAFGLVIPLELNYGALTLVGNWQGKWASKVILEMD